MPLDSRLAARLTVKNKQVVSSVLDAPHGPSSALQEIRRGTPEDSDGGEAALPAVRRGRSAHLKNQTTTIPAVEFPSLEDGNDDASGGQPDQQPEGYHPTPKQDHRIDRQGIKEIRNEQQTLRDQNLNLLKEVHDLRAQIESWTASPQSKTWAAVAAEEAQKTQTMQTTKPSPEYLLTDVANRHIHSALLHMEATKDTEVAGIGTTKTGYMVVFDSLEEMERFSYDYFVGRGFSHVSVDEVQDLAEFGGERTVFDKVTRMVPFLFGSQATEPVGQFSFSFVDGEIRFGTVLF
ncbi:hypothetical protein CNMCM8980_006459 [Aspergillus fumigatiaffinis]|nr:hypothetical protein CNMCM8980_006459 [Aspergillus fumigatiaffinis]